MAPRAYNNDNRQRQQAALKARIASAAAELHAAQGVLGTTYAEIARRASVSLPTVHSHYPTLDDLVRGCSAHVVRQAPPFSAPRILARPDLPGAVRSLVAAADRLNAYFEPWAGWREQQRLPALAAMAQQRREQITGLNAAVLARHLGPGDHRERAAAWEALLHFEFWQRLVRDHGLSRAAARRIQVHLLLAAAGPQPAAIPIRPARK